MSTQNTFITEELEGLIGRDNMPADIDEKTIENVIRGYIDERI